MAPPTKPTELRVLDGTFRKDRHKVSPAAEVLTDVPDPPTDLSDFGQLEWIEKGDILKSHGLLQPRYLECLKRFCMAAEQYEMAKRVVDGLGDKRFFQTEKGFIVAHPALKDMKDWDAKCKLYLTEMGMTPGSSGKMPSSGPTKSAVKSRSRA